jgi:glutaredoxin
MKSLLIIAVLAIGSFQMWQKYKPSTPVSPSFEEPYVAVYGRNSCGFTKQMLSNLERTGVNYHYFVVDNKQVATSLHSRMKASGISTKRYNLPVVDVNGYITVRPNFQSVLTDYNEIL